MFCSFLGRVLFASNFILSAYQDAGYSIVVVGNLLESYFISLGVLEKYKSLHSEKVQYLAIVIQNEEAYQISEVVKLLKWLDFIGVKNVCLYDMNGILKKFKETILQNLKNAKSIQVSDDDTDSIQTLTGLFLLIMEVSDDDTDSIQTVETLNDEILVSTADIHAWDISTILTFLTIKVQVTSLLL